MSRLLFGHFELQAQQRLLLADGVPVALRNRAFDVLRVLVEAHNHVIDKSALIDAAWGGRAIEENNLSVQISELRKVLGATAIRTVAGRGYGLAIPVRTDDAAATVPDWSKFESAGKSLLAPAPPDDLADERRLTVALAVILEDAPPQASSMVQGMGIDAKAVRTVLAEAGADLIHRNGGQCVSESWSACLVEFDNAPNATACAFGLQQLVCTRFGLTQPVLRMAMVSHSRPRPVAADDAAWSHLVRLARTASPGELRTDGALRDRVVDGLDCMVEEVSDARADDGSASVRSYRLTPCAPAAAPGDAPAQGLPLKPLLAILPFESRQTVPTTLAIGELIADGLIALLSHSRHHWRLVSRLSATAFRGRDPSSAAVKRQLGASFVVSGSYAEHNGGLVITMQVADCSSGEVLVARRLTGGATELLEQRSALLESMVAEIQGAIFGVELQRLRNAPIPALRSYTLLLGGIQLLHRSTPGDFDQSFRVLEQLSRWHPEAVEPHIWQAKWYALRAIQGRPIALEDDARAALRCTQAALEVDPDCAFALAMEGFVHVHLTRDLQKARECLQRAVALNPSETFAHLFHGLAQGTDGDFDAALVSHDMALSTSPLDPTRYLIDTIGAFLQLGGGHPHEAVRLAKSSLRLNANHAHSWRILAIAQQQIGAFAEASSSVQRVLRLQPDLTVRRYLANARPHEAFRYRFAEALQAAGLPA